MSSTTPPLPKLNSHGALYTEKRECQWWLEPDASAKDIEQIEKTEAKGADEQYLKKTISSYNEKWVRSARYFLTSYIVATHANNAGQRPTKSNDGLISAALTRIRDDNVVQQSISGIDAGTQEGLELGHRDVLAAVALLSRLDRSLGTETYLFRPETFDAQPKAES